MSTKNGTACKCPCGCSIWVSAKRNTSICLDCEGRNVFGKIQEPKHTGDPEDKKDKVSERFPKPDLREKCSSCRTPVVVQMGRVIHDPSYYVSGSHDITEVVV